MARTFDVMKQTKPARGYLYGSDRQEQIAKRYHATRIYKTGDKQTLPDYVMKAIKAKRYKVVQIGRSTYKYSLWALYK